MESLIALDSPVDAFAWNEYGTCTTPAIYYQFKGAGEWNYVTILLAARRHPLTGETRWYSAYRCAYKEWGASCVPGLGSKSGFAPPLPSLEAAAADCIGELLALHKRSWHPLFCPTALRELTALLRQLTTPAQLALF